MDDRTIQASIKAADTVISQTERRLKRAGLTRPYYLKKIKEFCEATKSISCVSGRDAGSGTVDFVDVPDYKTQVDGVKMIIDLYGDKAPVKNEHEIKGPVQIAIIDRFGAPK